MWPILLRHNNHEPREELTLFHIIPLDSHVNDFLLEQLELFDCVVTELYSARRPSLFAIACTRRAISHKTIAFFAEKIPQAAKIPPSFTKFCYQFDFFLSLIIILPIIFRGL